MEEIRNDEVEVKGFDTEEVDEVFDFEDEVETKKTVLDRAKDFGSGVINKAKDGIEYIKDHPDEAAEKGLSVLTVAGIGLLTIMGAKKTNEANRTVWSEEIDETVLLKRKLNNKDKKELDYRMKTGQTKIEALDDMNLMK